MGDLNLPNDIIVEILTWVPVKPLLKFRCVCKSWRTLISSKQFVTAHLRNSKSDRNFTSQRLLMKYEGNLNIMKYEGNLKQCSVNSVMSEPVSEAIDLSFPVQLETNELVSVMGSCNGLVCLWVGLYDLILWNPSTRIWKKLPDFGKETYRPHYSYYGFGFDKSSDDYKVVGVFYRRTDLTDKVVQVYSLRNDQWKKIKNFPFDGYDCQDATFANGKVYWLAYPGRYSGWEPVRQLYSFDLEKGEDEMIKMPSHMTNGPWAGLGAYEGSLLVFCFHGTSADVWIMDNNWTRLVTIPYFDDILKIDDTTERLVPFYVKHGRILLLYSPTLAIFDAKDCSFRYPEIRNSVDFIAIDTYLETLVSPLG